LVALPNVTIALADLAVSVAIALAGFAPSSPFPHGQSSNVPMYRYNNIYADP
jgi:hypothetical protein